MSVKHAGIFLMMAALIFAYAIGWAHVHQHWTMFGHVFGAFFCVLGGISCFAIGD